MAPENHRAMRSNSASLISVSMARAGLGLLLGLCGLVLAPAASALSDHAALGVVELDINGCVPEITEALAKLDIPTAQAGRMGGGVVLAGNISNYVPKENEKAEEDVIDVTYWAVVRDASGAVLSAKSGRENAHSIDGVCADVSEEIAGRLNYDLEH